MPKCFMENQMRILGKASWGQGQPCQQAVRHVDKLHEQWTASAMPSNSRLLPFPPILHSLHFYFASPKKKCFHPWKKQCTKKNNSERGMKRLVRHGPWVRVGGLAGGPLRRHAGVFSSQPSPLPFLLNEAVVQAPQRAHMLRRGSKCPITVNGLLFLN